jgi:hypothetical protein
MNLKVTSSTNISIGGSPTQNIIGSITEHLRQNEQGGLSGEVDLRFWYNQAAYDASLDRVFPVDNNVKVDSCSIVLSAAEAAAANLPLTIYQKCAEAIMAAHPTMTVVVI